jgi:hypothetical protein
VGKHRGPRTTARSSGTRMEIGHFHPSALYAMCGKLSRKSVTSSDLFRFTAAAKLSEPPQAVAMINVAAVTLRSNICSRVFARVGTLSSVIGMASDVPPIDLYVALLSVPGLATWNTLIARGLFMLGHGKPDGTDR